MQTLLAGIPLYDFMAAHVGNAVRSDTYLTDVQMDVRMDSTIWVERHPPGCLRTHALLKGNHHDLFDEKQIPEHGYVLKPKEFILARTMEFFHLPANVFGMLTLRSWAARSGLEQSTSQVLKPGFEGHLILELVNELRHHELLIKAEAPIAQIQFFEFG